MADANSIPSKGAQTEQFKVKEFELPWSDSSDHDVSMRKKIHALLNADRPYGNGTGSTHELAFDYKGIMWVSGQNHNRIARVKTRELLKPDGPSVGWLKCFDMGKDSWPHGLTFDKEKRHLWVGLQGTGELKCYDIENEDDIVQVDCVDVKLPYLKVNTQPHGMGLGPDDGSIWFTGKQTNSVGRVDRDPHVDPRVQHFFLQTTNAVPIYIAAGPDKNMWCTELYGNRIARISSKGHVDEYEIPTTNSRPITIVKSPLPDDKSMWFTQEAGGKIARINMEGEIIDEDDFQARVSEFRVPLGDPNSLLAALTFDDKNNLWVQQYVSPPEPGEVYTGNDYITKLGSALLNPAQGDLTNIPVTFFKAPSQRTIMHRIVQGPDGGMWFSELGLDKIGCVIKK